MHLAPYRRETKVSDAARYFTGRFVRTDLNFLGSPHEVDPDSAAEAMLVKDGSILAIGSRDEVPMPARATHIELG